MYMLGPGEWGVKLSHATYGGVSVPWARLA
jgi:hypothetical protein